MHLIIITLLLLVQPAVSLQLVFSKNMMVMNNSFYSAEVLIDRVNPQYTPSDITISYLVQNLVPQAYEYFDIFYYMDPADLDCYRWVIGNQSYLRNCSFLQNNFSRLQATTFPHTIINSSNLENVSIPSFYMIVDNTQYPYPNGAFQNRNISLEQIITINLTLNGMSQDIGTKLIYINTTVYIIYGVIISILYYKHRKNQKAIEEYDETQKKQQSQHSSEDEQIEISKSLRKTQKQMLEQNLN